jgi:hypothetical protein
MTARGRKGGGHFGVRLASQKAMLKGAGRKFSRYVTISKTAGLASKT